MTKLDKEIEATKIRSYMKEKYRIKYLGEVWFSVLIGILIVILVCCAIHKINGNTEYIKKSDVIELVKLQDVMDKEIEKITNDCMQLANSITTKIGKKEYKSEFIRVDFVYDVIDNVLGKKLIRENSKCVLKDKLRGEISVGVNDVIGLDGEPNKIVEYYKNGKIENEYYYLNGKSHRTNGPAMIWYYENGKVMCESYYINDKLHRTNGPAIIWYNENGRVEREFYYLNGKLHRTNGPAVIWYHKNGNIESEFYYINNKSHRINGPADIYYYENGMVDSEYYYLNDEKLTKEQFEVHPLVKGVDL